MATDLQRLHGDCREVLATLPADSIDACVTDPPYHLIQGGIHLRSMTVDGKGNHLKPRSAGFMNQAWDGGNIAADPDTWREVLRVLKPGAHLVAFGGTRTQHRMVCAIEDAGFEIRDCLMWLYGTGFPKSHDVSKGIDKAAGAERAVIGRYESPEGTSGRSNHAERIGTSTAIGGLPDITAPATPEAVQWSGWGTALKPAYEPIILARKPLIGTVAQNVLAHGCGGLNIDSSRVQFVDGDTTVSAASAGLGAGRNSGKGTSFHATVGGVISPAHALGRWPANLLHDGSDEVEAAFAAFGERTSGDLTGQPRAENKIFGSAGATLGRPRYYTGDTGSASRFFYSAKAGKGDRANSKHPTIKPIALMRWLCRLVTPPGGRILDPFAGSGTTGEAAMLEGFSALLIEQAAEHSGDIEHRIGRWHGADLPLFAEAAD